MKNTTLPKPALADYAKRDAYNESNEKWSHDQEMVYLEFMNSIDWSAEIFTVDDKHGLKTALGEVILPPIFEDIHVYKFIEYNKDKLVTAAINGKYGVVEADGVGTWVIEPKFDYIGIPNSLTHVYINNKWGVIKVPSGEYLIPPVCDSISRDNGFLFVNDIAIYEKDGKTGVITSNGHFTDPQFDEVEWWDDGAVKVKLKGEWGYIDENDQFTTDEDESYYSCNSCPG